MTTMITLFHTYIPLRILLVLSILVVPIRAAAEDSGSDIPSWSFTATITECEQVSVPKDVKYGVTYSEEAVKHLKNGDTVVVGVDVRWRVRVELTSMGNNPLKIKELSAVQFLIHSPAKSFRTSKPNNKRMNLQLSYRRTKSGDFQFIVLRVKP